MKITEIISVFSKEKHNYYPIKEQQRKELEKHIEFEIVCDDEIIEILELIMINIQKIN